MGIYGQDWASYQSATPDTTGLSFAFVKVTEGLTYTNPEWTSQRDHARAAGLVVGYYHYPDMANSAQQEASRFLSISQPAVGEMLCLDWEGYDAANASVPMAQQVAYKDAFLSAVKAAAPNNPVGVYMNTDYLRQDTSGDHGDFLWIATSGLPAGQPGISADWLFHQYSDSGSADQDYCPLASTADLAAWAASFNQEDDVLTQDMINEWNGMIWGLKNTCEATQAQVGQLQQQLAAQAAAISTLAGLLGAQQQGVNTAQVVAAVQAAIAAAVVKVDVDVTQSAAPPAGS